MSRSLRGAWKLWGSWCAVIAYAGLIAYMSLREFGDSPIERAIDGVGRAYFHLPAYAGLAGLLALVMPSSGARGRRVGIAFLAATAYGWLLEVAQIAAPTRSFNLLGLAFDAAGAAAGAVAALALLFLCERRSRRGS
ncbi:MAG: VanZ family protein [bacterium]